MQMEAGKAFEYALLKEFEEKLKGKTTVYVINNSSLYNARQCFFSFNNEERGRYLLTASFAVNFLIDIEPRLSHSINDNDILQLELLTDRKGESGDVRDVLVIRLLQKWEIGISAKNNHHAVKHSRLSKNIDFGEKWLKIKCSKEYFDEIQPIFDYLEELKESSGGKKTWKSLDNYHMSVYRPILNAFKKELCRIHDTHTDNVAALLVEYLVGKKDYYKVIKVHNAVEIQAYNLHGTLNLPFNNIEPKFKTPVISPPNKITRISFKDNCDTTLIVNFDRDWDMSFRIHNASSKIEPSLKFDINLLRAPNSMFTNTLSIG